MSRCFSALAAAMLLADTPPMLMRANIDILHDAATLRYA